MALINKEEFNSAVYQTVLDIPKGKVATYGQIAKLLGLPTYSRQVGSDLLNSLLIVKFHGIAL